MSIKKHGREYQGLCPFHNEKSPSFTVNDEKGFYHCFGCGAHGDAIEFVRKFERLSYVETMETLAREAGIPIPEPSAEEHRKAEVAKTLYDVMDAASQWFEKQLAASTGAIALDYVEKRGLKPDTVRTFRIGFAPDERTALHQHLLKAGFSQALQAEAGLIIVPEQGAPYDRFRGRVIFPIRNASGKIIAFGGRLLPSLAGNKNLPKYLNSPETPLFKKGEGLYNIDLAKKNARESNMAVVMEGYMDVVSTSQSGINYAVATLGTAVTPEHLRLLWQLAREPIMCLDGDAAGQRAMMRAAEVALPLLKPGYSLRFAMLPKGDDPDTYVSKHGKESFEKLLVTSRRLSQILWETMSPQYKIDLPEGRAALENALKLLSDKIADSTVRAHYASYFRKLMWNKAPVAPRMTQERSANINHIIVQHPSATLDKLVQTMLRIMLKFPPLLYKAHRDEIIAHLDIKDSNLNQLRNALLASFAHVTIEDEAAFVENIRMRTSDDIVDSVLKAALKLPYSDAISENDAAQLWQETLAAYQHEHQNLELKELETSLQMNWNEETYFKMAELKQAMLAKNPRTFAPAESTEL